MDVIKTYFTGRSSRRLFAFVAFVFYMLTNVVSAQEQRLLSLSEAITLGVNNYQSIQAKRNYLNASTALVQDAKNQYLPNVIASVQNDYGNINGQYGPLLGGLGLGSSGPVTSSQNWDAAFGALYLVNTNWEFFTFGRLKSRILLANTTVKKDSADLQQEEFVQSVKISGAYLNLLAAQKFVQNAEANLQRALAVQQAVTARTKSGLIAGVDSSIANAEVSRARLALIDARNNEQLIGNQLAQLLNLPPVTFLLDTTLFTKVPAELNTANPVEQNPQVKFYQRRVEESNIASTFKIKQQVRAQQFITDAYKNEYDQITTQLKDQLFLSDQRIANSLQSVHEVPLQYKAAADAYVQKSVLYKNGLTDIIDLQQALFTLNRAETDMSVAYINVWQALLLKAAASGDFDLFIRQVK